MIAACKIRQTICAHITYAFMYFVRKYHNCERGFSIIEWILVHLVMEKMILLGLSYTKKVTRNWRKITNTNANKNKHISKSVECFSQFKQRIHGIEYLFSLWINFDMEFFFFSWMHNSIYIYKLTARFSSCKIRNEQK